MAETLLIRLELKDFATVYLFLLKEYKKREGDRGKRKIELKKENYQYEVVEEKISSYIKEVGECRFSEMPYVSEGKEGKITAFLSVLSLVSHGDISINQEKDEDIFIKRIKKD